jgi:hypothetical protein
MDTIDMFRHIRRATRYDDSLSLSLTIDGYINGPCMHLTGIARALWMVSER